jgi:hypothetical protein
MWALLSPAVWKLLPYLFGIAGDVLFALIAAAKPKVEQAAIDQKLPDGTARHEFVVNEIVPVLKSSGSLILDNIYKGLVPLATEIAYRQLQKKLAKEQPAPSKTIPPIIGLVLLCSMFFSGCALLNKEATVISNPYPKTELTSTENPETKAVVDKVVLQDKATSLSAFNTKLSRYAEEGGWKIIVPAYLNNLPAADAEGIYVVTLERTRPQ